MKEEDKIKLLKLSEEDKKKKIKELRKELNKIKKDNDLKREQREKLKIVNTWDIEQELQVLSHNFIRKDIVLLNTYEIAEIERLIGTYHYYVFVHDTTFKGGIGTRRKVHQKEILCHIVDLNLEKEKNLEYKQRGYRRINYLKNDVVM